MRASVVIATSNRGQSLRALLGALRHQTFGDFEVVVVKGPSTDDTDQVLADWASDVRVVHNPELNLSRSRNLGIDVAAGEIVAFIDDDAVPEPSWLESLMAHYQDEAVGGVGGFVYDITGVNMQFRYAVSDRIGRTDFERLPPFDDFMKPGADPFVYLQGTNMSFRRGALEAVGGFDENIEYVWDDVDIAMHLIDDGWRILPLDHAAVHHKVLPSALRRGQGEVTDPFTPVKNRTYFALRSGIATRPAEEIVRSLTDHLDLLQEHARTMQRIGRFTVKEAENFATRARAGFEEGFEQGFNQPRARRTLAAAEPDRFNRFAVLAPDSRRLSVCFISLDYPPRPMGGIARYTVDLARGIASLGHEVHVVTQADLPYRIEFEDGVWVHRYPAGPRLVASLEGHPLKDNLVHVARVWRAVAHLAERFPLDVVAGNVWLAEALACALDPRWETVMTLSTPLRTIASTQPAVAAKPEVAWQIKLENAAMARADRLQSVSEANLRNVRHHSPLAAAVPIEVVWHGITDRSRDDAFRPEHDGVEILFVGRLEPRKGIDTLLEAGIELLRERPNVRIRIAGADNPYASLDHTPYAERVKERLAQYPNLLERISFEGEVSEATLDELLRGCDIFCAPSRYESFGLMNLEAMMFSRPVVSCRVGGIEEVVVSGETGILVEPDDADRLREALRTLVDDAALRERMGVAGRRRFEVEFSNEIAVQRTLDLLSRTVGPARIEELEGPESEAVVRRSMAEVMTELGGIADPAAAADELLDPTAFPCDYVAAIEQLKEASPHEFVAGLYRAILQREADLEGIESRVPGLISGGISRTDVIREIAAGEEARWRGVDARFLERLHLDAPIELIRRVRTAFLRDDETFARVLEEVFVPPTVPHDPEIAALISGARDGGDRHAALSNLVGLKEIRDRLPQALALLQEEFFTSAELRQEFASLATSDEPPFVDGVYQLLLGRDPELEAVAGNAQRLREVSRRQLVAEIAGSREAVERGIDAGVVDAIAAEIPELQAIPTRPASMLQRIERVPGGPRARHVGRRLLRDPNVRVLGAQVRELREAVHGYGQFAQKAARESTQQLERLAAEVRGLTEEIDGLMPELSAQIARPKPGSYGTYLGRGRVMVALTWGGSLLAPADDLSLTPELVTHGIYEASFAQYLMRTLRSGMRAVDIGANIGMHTMLMAGWVGAEGHVLAYEPNPDVLSFLEANVALNWVSDRVTVRPVGVSEATGRRTLFVSERFQGNSSLLMPGEDYFANVPMDTIREVDVEVVTLDRDAESLGHIDLVKIDVEGTECSVIKGMSRLLEAGRVDRVCFEVYRDRAGDGWPEFAEVLSDFEGSGWRFHEIEQDGSLIQLKLDRLLEVGRYGQIVMCRGDTHY